MPGIIAADPGPGGLRNALTYNLMGPPSLGPLNPVAGDVPMFEFNVLSDLIRFNPAGTGNNPNYPASLVFYSDIDDLFDASAFVDKGFPTASYTNVVTVAEGRPENEAINGASYTPTPGQPGFIPGFDVEYGFTSDFIPEPSSALLVFCGTGLILLRRRFRRARP